MTQSGSDQGGIITVIARHSRVNLLEWGWRGAELTKIGRFVCYSQIVLHACKHSVLYLHHSVCNMQCYHACSTAAQSGLAVVTAPAVQSLRCTFSCIARKPAQQLLKQCYHAYIHSTRKWSLLRWVHQQFSYHVHLYCRARLILYILHSSCCCSSNTNTHNQHCRNDCVCCIAFIWLPTHSASVHRHGHNSFA